MFLGSTIKTSLAAAEHVAMPGRRSGRYMVGLFLSAIITGYATVWALWSYNPVIAVLCAPLAASFVTGSTALLIFLIETSLSKSHETRARESFKPGGVS